MRDYDVTDTASVNRIFMSDKSDRSVLLERQPDNSWKLNGNLDAHRENIQTLLFTMANMAVREPVARAAHNNILTLLASRSVKVEVYQNSHRVRLGRYHFFPYEKLAKTYFIGDATMDNNGTYALMEGADSPVVVYLPGLRGYISSRFSTLENDWRVHTVFNKKLPEIKDISVEFTQQPQESFKVINNANTSLTLVRLIDNQTIFNYDTIQLMAFVNAFRNIRFEALMNDMEPAKRDSLTSQVPVHKILLNATDGSVQSVKTFARILPVPEIDVFDGSTVTFDRDRLYALINDDKDFVMIQYFVFDKVLRPLSAFTRENQQ